MTTILLALSLSAALRPATDCPGVARQAYALAELLDAGVRVDAPTFRDPWVGRIVTRWSARHEQPEDVAQWALVACAAQAGGGVRMAGD